MATTFDIQRAQSRDGPYTVVASGLSTLSADLTGQPVASALYYRVLPYHDGIAQEPSSPVVILTLDKPLLRASSGAGATYVNLTWNSTCASLYHVYRYDLETNKVLHVAYTTDTTFRDYGVGYDTPYLYLVCSVIGEPFQKYENFESGFSNIVAGYIPAIGVFSMPLGTRGTVYQGIQIAEETTPGVLVPCTHRLKNINFDFTPNIPKKEVKYPGSKLATDSQRGQERTDGKYTGALDYNTLEYIISSMLGEQSPTVLGTLAQKRVWNPSPVVPVVPKTFTVEQGSAKGAEKLGFVIFDSLDIKWAEDTADVSGTMFGNGLVRDAVLTTGPLPVVPPMAVDPINIGVYMSTDGGATYNRLVKGLDGSVHLNGLFKPTYHINDTLTSFDDVTEKMPDFGALITTEEGSEADTFMARLYDDQVIYLRLQAKGPVIETILTDPAVAPTLATATTGGTIAPGTYLVAYSYKESTGETKVSPTASIVVPAGTSTNTITLTAPALPSGATGINGYEGTTSSNLLGAGTSGTNSLVITALGGGAAAPTVSTLNTYYLLQIELPVRVMKPDPKDVADVWGNEFTFTAADDETFGMCKVTLINKLTTIA